MLSYYHFDVVWGRKNCLFQISLFICKTILLWLVPVPISHILNGIIKNLKLYVRGSLYMFILVLLYCIHATHSTQHITTPLDTHTHNAHTYSTKIFYESMYIHVYGCQWSPWLVPFDFFNLSKIHIYGCFAAVFRSKFDQNLNFLLSRCGYSFGRVSKGFGASNEITIDLLKHFDIFHFLAILI